MTRLPARITLLALTVLLALTGCLFSGPTWQPNGTGHYTGYPVRRIATTLSGQDAQDAVETVTSQTELVVPATATDLTVEKITIEFYDGRAQIDDATVLRFTVPAADTDLIKQALTCWTDSDGNWDTVEKRAAVLHEYALDMLGDVVDPTWRSCSKQDFSAPRLLGNRLILMSNTDPTQVVMTAYPQLWD